MTLSSRKRELFFFEVGSSGVCRLGHADVENEAEEGTGAALEVHEMGSRHFPPFFKICEFIPEQTFLLLHIVVDQVLLTKGEDGFSVLLPNGASCPWDHGIPDMDPADMAKEAYTGVGEEGGVVLVCFYTGRKDISQKIPYGVSQ